MTLPAEQGERDESEVFFKNDRLLSVYSKDIADFASLAYRMRMRFSFTDSCEKSLTMKIQTTKDL